MISNPVAGALPDRTTGRSGGGTRGRWAARWRVQPRWSCWQASTRSPASSPAGAWRKPGSTRCRPASPPASPTMSRWRSGVWCRAGVRPAVRAHHAGRAAPPHRPATVRGAGLHQVLLAEPTALPRLRLGLVDQVRGQPRQRYGRFVFAVFSCGTGFIAGGCSPGTRPKTACSSSSSSTRPRSSSPR